MTSRIWDAASAVIKCKRGRQQLNTIKDHYLHRKRTVYSLGDYEQLLYIIAPRPSPVLDEGPTRMASLSVSAMYQGTTLYASIPSAPNCLMNTASKDRFNPKDSHKQSSEFWTERKKGLDDVPTLWRYCKSMLFLVVIDATVSRDGGLHRGL